MIKSKWITNIIYIKTSQDNCYYLSSIEDPYPCKAIIYTSLVIHFDLIMFC